MHHFDYAAPAELFSNPSPRNRAPVVRYRRFPSGAEAVRFAVEELPQALLIGVTLEADEERFGHQGIRELYNSPAYPLPRADRAN